MTEEKTLINKKVEEETTKDPVNILTIDFDYIMSPCINLYNDMCSGNQNPTESWERIEAERKINNHISYDATSICNIAIIIKYILTFNKECKFHVVKDHQDLIDVVGVNDSDDIYNVTNIDFHHDIYYRPEDVVKMDYYHDYNCSNWLAYMYYIDKLNTYTWIKAANSDQVNLDMFDDELKEKITIQPSVYLQDYTKSCMANKLDPKVDHIVFCLSPQWVPYRYHHLFYMLADIFKDWVGDD